ncbi:MAG: methylenetetrahydrofolate reductase [Hyphomicrobiales bacterium]|nr:methylenetetrahydrofolate reductase [Hyphomicrobiales bacterium]
MASLGFQERMDAPPVVNTRLSALLNNYSIEIMPSTARKIGDFRKILPAGTRIYVAHVGAASIDDMVATAKRLSDQGFPVMPHFPARIIKNEAMLTDWIARYQKEAGVNQALLVAGGFDEPCGVFENSIQLLETGLFDKAGFNRLHVAGHPEGNRDIDPDGSTKKLDAALSWKQYFSERTDADMAIVNQFCFESGPVIAWVNRLKSTGIDLPVHIGIAGPARLRTMIKYAISCGVGPSRRVLQRRAKDLTKLLLSFEPTEILSDLADYKASNPDSNIASVHFFPFGGIKNCAAWAQAYGGAPSITASQD